MDGMMTNENQQFMPAWAEKTLGPKPNTDLERSLLWAFFDAWEALHAIPNCQGNRKKSELAAELLVEAAHAVRTLRAPAAIERIGNG